MNVIKRHEDVLSKRPGCEKKLHNVKGAERWWNKTEKVHWGHAAEGSRVMLTIQLSFGGQRGQALKVTEWKVA